LPLRNRTRTSRVLWALLIIVSCAAGVYYTFFMWLARVPTGSMMNTIIPGDRIVVHRSFGLIKRGRIVVFQYPNDSTYVIARVIGLPGETIQLQGKTVYINQRPLDEQTVMVNESDSYAPLEELSTAGTGPYRVFYTKRLEDLVPDLAEFGTREPFLIPADSYYVMGDNRDNSEDSRYRGAVPRKLIWGDASMIYYSETMPDGEKIRWERMFRKVH
jgi:signal peptidase I